MLSKPKCAVQGISAESQVGWASIDQAIVSGGNFLVNILLARSLEPSEFGRFAVVFVALQFCLVVHTSAIGGSLAIFGGSEKPQIFTQHLTASCGLSLALLIAACVLLTVVTTVAQTDVSLSLILGTIASQYAHETLKRALAARLQFRTCTTSDLVTYGGRFICLLFIALSGRVELEEVFATFLVFALFGAVVSGRALEIDWPSVRMPLGAFQEIAKRHISIVGWAAGGAVLSILATLVIQLGLAAAHGPAETAKLHSMVVILSLTHPIIAFMQTAVAPIVASRNRVKGPRAAYALGVSSIAGGAAALLPLWIVLLVFPREALNLIYGSNAFAGIEQPLVVYTIAYLLLYLGLTMTAMLTSLKAGRAGFLIQLANGFTALVLAVPATSAFGLWGAVGTTLVGATSGVVVGAFCLRKWLHSTRE